MGSIAAVLMRSNGFAATAFFLISLGCFAQDFETKGKVVDEQTNLALPFANLQVEMTTIGTSSNAEGDFKLVIPSRYYASNLLISYIGYATRKIPLANLTSAQIIKLKPENRQLRELVVMPDSSLLVFLREAYNSIEENYTQKPYQLEGFYRESLRTDSGRYFYFGEAQLLLQGSGYQFEQEMGNVKVVKSRVNHFANGDTLRNALYYGGLFIGIKYDLIKRRPTFLKPNKRKYEYHLTDITTNEGKEVWVVGFKAKNGEQRGKLFIEKESKAYLRAEVTDYYNKDSIGYGLSSKVRHIKSTKRLFYRKNQNKWFLNYADVQQTDFNRDLKLKTVVTGEFVVNKVQADSIKLLSFNDRLEYTQVFSQIQDNFQEDFWKGTTVLVPDSTLQTQLKPYHTEQNRKELLAKSTDSADEKVIKVQPKKKKHPQRVLLLTRLGFSIGTQLIPYNVAPSNLSLNYSSGLSSFNFDRRLNGVGFPLLLSTEFSVKLSRQWQVFYGSSADLSSGYEFLSRQLGLRYTLLINKKGRPVLLRPSIAYGSHELGWSFPTFSNPDGVLFGNKRILTKELSFGVGERIRFLRPFISIDKKINGLKWVYINVGCYLTLERENRIFLKEESGFFLFRGQESTSLEGSGGVVKVDGQPLPADPKWFSQLYVEMGMRWAF